MRWVFILGFSRESSWVLSYFQPVRGLRGPQSDRRGSRLSAPVLRATRAGHPGVSANATDTFGNHIPDLFFTWAVVPRDGDATLTPARDGATTTLQNVVMINGAQAFTAGNVVVVATARFHGQTASGTSTVVKLAP